MPTDFARLIGIGACHRAAARYSAARQHGVMRQRCHGEAGLLVTQKRRFLMDGRIAKRPLCAARMVRAS